MTPKANKSFGDLVSHKKEAASAAFAASGVKQEKRKTRNLKEENKEEVLFIFKSKL